MKYVSPQTEKRKQRQKKRKQQLLVCVCFAAVIIGLAVAIVAFTGKDEPAQSSSQTNSEIVEINSENIQEENSTSTPESESAFVTESESTSDEPQESEEPQTESSPQAESTPKPSKNKNKKSFDLFGKIKSLFVKEEIVEVVFPAMSFGVQVHEAADSIISLSPLATEIILSSPSQHALTAVSEYCNKRGNELMTVGTPLIPKADKIIQLAPDYLIVQTPLGQQDKIKIEQSGIKVLQLKSPETLEDLKEIYRSVTALTQGADIATIVSEDIYNDLTEKLNLYTTALENANKKSAVMLFNSYGMVATEDTIEGKLISTFFDIQVNGKNYFAENISAVAATNPQVLIVSDLISQEQLAALGFAETEAYISGNIYYVDIQSFENVSAKSIKTLMGIANSVYGSLIQPPPAETE